MKFAISSYRADGNAQEKLGAADDDAQNLVAAECSMDRFLCTFRLAWEPVCERNPFAADGHFSPEKDAEMDA